jgi:hypothetical protein
MIDEERMMLNFNTLLKFLVTGFFISVLAACSSVSETPASKMSEEPLGNAMFGAYIKGAAWDKDILFGLEKTVGHEFKIVHWFTSWDDPFEGALVKHVLDLGRIPLITWQSKNQSVSDIAAGKHDTYIRTWAQGIGDLSGDVYLRPFPEMNGDWTTWNGNPKTLVAAWKHIVNIFREEGATNARWVWSPNVRDEPATAENRMELYYPGERYADILALDGYNWGTTRSYTAWKPFEQIFEDAYGRITTLGKQHVWVAEVASTEHGGDKGEWVKGMLGSTAFPRIDALVWFNENKETDWRMESSSDSLSAFREWFSDGARAQTILASQ